MLSDQIENFKRSGITLSAADIVDTYQNITDGLINQWAFSSSADGDGREEVYRQLRGLEAIMTRLISGWSK
jgi:hypothetical protein